MSKGKSSKPKLYAFVDTFDDNDDTDNKIVDDTDDADNPAV